MAKAKSTHKPSTPEPPAPDDGCPSCLARDVKPHTTTRPDEWTVVGAYTCHRCGETWQTSYWEAAG